MTRLLLSIFAVASLSTSYVLANTESYDERASIKIQAEQGKPFAEDLTKYTKIGGGYSVLEIPSWLTLTDKGILFGAPTSAHLGVHEAFVSALYNGQEYNFHLIVTVGNLVVPVKYDFVAVVDDVFKVDLSKLEGKAGKFTFTGLPAWIHAQNNGVLYGLPKKENVGVTTFEVLLENTEKPSAFKVKLTVKGASVQPVAVLKEGGEISLDVFKILSNEPGLYYLNSPIWLTLHSTGELEGRAPIGSAGMHTVSISVRNGTSHKIFTFYIQVTK